MSEHHSWELLGRGDAKSFIDALCNEAMAHSAVRHEYLRRLAAGDFPNMKAAIRDYCHQYYFYSAEFTTYLEAVIGGLKSASHRDSLRHNLEEERGLMEEMPSGEDAIPHTELFGKMRRAAGVTEEYERLNPPSATALIWRDLFLQKCQSRQEGVGVGAIGIATEMIVSTIYPYILRAVQEHSDMNEDDYLFLKLHLDCDDEHADDLKQIAIDIAGPYEVREAIRFGVVSALNLRTAFWDVMLGRATAMPSA